MATIFRKDKTRITIAEAKRLILETLPPEKHGAVYAHITPDGEIDWDGPVNVIEEVRVLAAPFIDRDFPVMLAHMQIEPMMRFRPAIRGYPENKAMEAEYTIAHDEFFRVADGYGLLVEIGEASPPQVEKQEAATPAPVATEQAASNAKPWLTHDPRDPAPEQPWYTPARYFARQLVITDSTLLTKRLTLADKVSTSLAGAGIYKRGGKKPHSADTVLKAFANVTLG